MDKIYLDNAATTKPSTKVILAMKKAAEKTWGNPSSIHSVGQEAHRVLDSARKTVAEFLHCEFDEIIFTSGGSESDNLAIRGLVSGIRYQVLGGSGNHNTKYVIRNTDTKPHIVISAIEHHAVLHTVQDLEKEDLIEATYVLPNKEGVVEVDAIRQAVKDNTVLVSVMYVNNETGVINPIGEIGQMIDDLNNGREFYDSTPKDHVLHIKNHNRIYFHTDAVQAAEYFDLDVDKLKVDLLTLTAHKFHGPRGAGVLYVRKGTPMKAEVTGGAQELRVRAGTENIAAIAGMAIAIKEVESGKLKVESIKKLRIKLENGLLKAIPNSILNGDREKRAPHIVNISFINAEGEAIILNLDFLGIAVSSGSACTSRSLDPSHVLTAMGIPAEKAHGSIRFSLSRETTEAEIDKVLEVMPGIIEKLRAMSPFQTNSKS